MTRKQSEILMALV